MNGTDMFRGINVTASSAIAINNLVLDTNIVEYYIKTINEISLNTVEQNLPLSFADSATFNNISDLPLSEVGIAKFMAAAHLGKEVHENSIYFNNRSFGKPDLPTTHPINFVQMFPNPTFDKINFIINSDAEINLIIYDAPGKIVFTTNSIKNNYIFDCSYLLPGLYRYQIVSTEFSDTGNFVIIR